MFASNLSLNRDDPPLNTDRIVCETAFGIWISSLVKLTYKIAQAVFNSSGTKAYVSNLLGYISVIDTATGTFTNIGTANGVLGLAINGSTLYATGVNTVFVIDTNSNAITHTIHVPGPAQSGLGFPALTTDGAFLYVPVVSTGTNGTGDQVVVIDTRTKKVVGQPINVGQQPLQIAVAAGDVFGFVANSLSGNVTVLKLRHSNIIP